MNKKKLLIHLMYSHALKENDLADWRLTWRLLCP